jgi:Holliday junction resolvase RusA-like endonuclease
MDAIVDLTSEHHDEASGRTHTIEVAGNPVCLPRARTSWKSMQRHYNPVTKDLKAFKNTVKSVIPQTQFGYIYPRTIPVTLTLIFHMKRPNSDFINNQRGHGRLRQNLPFSRSMVPDIDNLAKFVLDGLNEVLYEDDRQVVKLTIYKLLDNHGLCEGRTTIIISPFQEQDLPLP